jgi:hypothetical protein
MGRRFVDKPMPLENDVVSDRQPFIPKITDIDHHMSMGQISGLVPEISAGDLSDGEAWARCISQAATSQKLSLLQPLGVSGWKRRLGGKRLPGPSTRAPR